MRGLHAQQKEERGQPAPMFVHQHASMINGIAPTDLVAAFSPAIDTLPEKQETLVGIRFASFWVVMRLHTLAHHRYPLILCVISTTLAACGSSVPSDSDCRNLTYKEEGLSRSEYLPCAGEIVAALDQLDQQSQAASRGDKQARSDGQATLGRVNALMREAGGHNLLERWSDRALTDLNVSISNAVTKYEAFYMVRVTDGQFAAETRAAAAAELQGASRRYQEARSSYRRLQ
jgi:hypothetical protein